MLQGVMKNNNNKLVTAVITYLPGL